MNKPAVGWPDVDHSRTPLAWSLPTNLMPPVAAGWSPGTRRNASEAESILSEAVAWWDPTVSGFRDGDRWLRNSGTAGGLLDLRLGSSVVANTNDPKWLGPEDVGYVYIPGVTSNNMSVPNEAALNFTTGDFEIIVRVAPDVSTPSATWTFAGKATNVTLSEDSYQFRWGTNGFLTLQLANTSYVQTAYASTSAFTPQAGHPYWLRVTYDANNGTGNGVVNFYTSTSAELPSSWTALGNAVSKPTITLNTVSWPVTIGATNAGVSPVFGRMYRAIIKSGIDGTTVLDVDCDAITTGSATSFTATTGQTVTINRSTSGRKSVAVPARRLGGRACFLFGTDDYMEVVDNWQHQLLNFRQADSCTVLASVRQWATPTSNGVYLGKRQAGSLGYVVISNNTASSIAPRIADGTTALDRAGLSTFTLGTVTSFGFVVDRAAQTFASFSGGAVAATASTSSITNVVSNTPVRVGRESYATNYQDFEFRAAAIFRRPLTAREISVLSTYYSGG